MNPDLMTVTNSELRGIKEKFLDLALHLEALEVIETYATSSQLEKLQEKIGEIKDLICGIVVGDITMNLMSGSVGLASGTVATLDAEQEKESEVVSPQFLSAEVVEGLSHKDKVAMFAKVFLGIEAYGEGQVMVFPSSAGKNTYNVCYYKKSSQVKATCSVQIKYVPEKNWYEKVG